MEGGLWCSYDVHFVRSLARHVALTVLSALLIAVAGCSGSPDTGQQNEGEQGSGDRPAGVRARETDTLDRVLDTRQADGSVGERVEIGDVSLRLFGLRSEDVAFYAPGPGQPVGEKDSPSGEFVAVDFVAQNDSGSGVTIRPEAILEDDSGDRHRRDESVRIPNLVDGTMQLASRQKRASTMIFAVPNGTMPERLGVRISEEEARFDLLSDNTEKIPPDDYLRVYHLYFAQRAYEEAYEMYDPDTTQDVTLGDWTRFYEPVWGSRYIGLDSLTRVFVGETEASYEMDRTFYGRDGEPVEDPALNAPVLQDMVRADGAWKLVMGDDLIDAISAEVPRFFPPTEEPPEPTNDTDSEPETTAPENTTREPTTASPAGDYSCNDFRTQEEAQLYLAPGDPYVLDPDGNGIACDYLP